MSETSVHTRTARPGDQDDIWPLARDFATSFAPRREAFDTSYLELLERSDTLLLVAEDDEALTGYLLASDHLTFLANGRVCWVEEVMVAVDARRRGVGRALMTGAQTWASRRGSAYVSLASRRAGQFYEALGYDDSATFFKKTLA